MKFQIKIRLKDLKLKMEFMWDISSQEKMFKSWQRNENSIFCTMTAAYNWAFCDFIAQPNQKQLQNNASGSQNQVKLSTYHLDLVSGLA